MVYGVVAQARLPQGGDDLGPGLRMEAEVLFGSFRPNADSLDVVVASHRSRLPSWSKSLRSSGRNRRATLSPTPGRPARHSATTGASGAGEPCTEAMAPNGWTTSIASAGS